MGSEMLPHANLVSDSLLINSTIDLLISLGGSASAVEVVDYVMRIRDPHPDFARMLVVDLIDRDPRLSLEEGLVHLTEPDHNVRRLGETGFVVFDLETTGAKAPPCRVIEIGAFLVKGGAIANEFHSLVNPGTPIPPFISSLTGISDEMVSGAPAFGEVAPDFLEFVGDSVLVAHNIGFDMHFLNYEVGRVYDGYSVWNSSLCTVQLSRGLLPDIENHKLKTVANYFAVELVNHHRAGEDAKATAKVFIHLLDDLKARGVETLGAARRFCRHKQYAKRSEAAA
ncbi:MAG: PolC-type DNA polymerase III [Pyrinomonadaceae bacterium]